MLKAELFIILLLPSILNAGPVGSVPEALGHYGYQEGEVLEFYEAVKKNVQKNDVIALSKQVRYPIKMWGKASANNSTEFIEVYNRLITPPWKSAIVKQTFDGLAVTTEGIMFDRGRIWFSKVCEDKPCEKPYFAITTINSW